MQQGEKPLFRLEQVMEELFKQRDEVKKFPVQSRELVSQPYAFLLAGSGDRRRNISQSLTRRDRSAYFGISRLRGMPLAGP
jgi:hypothetical protein